MLNRMNREAFLRNPQETVLSQLGQSIVMPFYGSSEPLPFHILAAKVARFEHRDSVVREAVVEALGGQSNLPEVCLGLQ